MVSFPNETVCVWLDETTSNYDNNIWSTSGCVTINETGTGTRCECDHLTSFSILMKVTEYDIPMIHGKVLSILTFIGCGVSIVCAILIVILFLCLRLMKEERILHSMLLVAIAAGQLTFLVGIDRTDNKIGCKVIAIVIQYFMTASFSWMLIESIYLYRHVVKVFSSRVNIIYYVVAGWGVPIVLVGISLGISFDHIPSENFCWLSTEGGAIYAFVAPALAVIVINIVLLGIVLREIRRIIDRDITKIDVSKAKTTAKVLLVFTPVMGAPWVFGILAINEDTVIFDYLFTALNSFQILHLFDMTVCNFKRYFT
ncbi:adhesion G-protein coupled receptor D1-like [Strongylocentrotus purpuratus]|uniref:Uncharacterized protein n=1 Tax=Strongylocentrotus purpuratus TaxID=7668 RepID=A0A7M7N0V1_STRPU|nr:adhesion G-protein coupled receptor D1-like [Strongylocentrotus purpuratus]